jgi:RNA-binding protein YhbY
MESISELRKRGKALNPITRIGQKGITDSAILEIRKHIKSKKLIKVKLLKNFMEGNDKKQAVLELVQKTDSVLIDFVGFTVVLANKEIVFGKN